MHTLFTTYTCKCTFWFSSLFSTQLLEVKCNSGHTGLCVLQPLTSVLCCLSLLKHHLHSNLTALLSKQCSLHTMHNPPPASTVPRAQLKNEPVRYADTASAGSKACCDESLAKYRASQPELYCSLQLLFFDSADRDGGILLASSIFHY